MFDDRQLECFVAVAEEGHFGRAARRLNMTQPPLTRRMHRLESEVGAALFVRGAHGVDLTPPGEVLLVEARRLLDGGARAFEMARAAEAGWAGRLLVGYTGTAVLDLMPQILATFTESYPDISLSLRRMGKAQLHRAIDDGVVHVGFARVQSKSPGSIVQPVGSAELCVALPRRVHVRPHPALIDLAQHPMVLFPRTRPSFADEVLTMCERAGFSPIIAAEADDVLEAVAYVSTGAAIALVSQPTTGIHLPGVRYEPLTDSPKLELSCIARADASAPVIHTFMSHLAKWDRERAR